MDYIIDTHALHWFLEDSSSLSSKAAATIRDASLIYIPSIVLLEAFFVSKKKYNLSIFAQFLKTIPNEKFAVLPLSLDQVKICVSLNVKLEIHDLIIISAAKLEGVPIITKDPQIAQVYSQVIW